MTTYYEQYYDANKDRITAKARADYSRSDKKWAYNLQRNYGMTAEQYEDILVAQDGVCAICGGHPKGRITRLVVDHDHETGRVRGLLCTSCNHLLGNASDKPYVLYAAAAYLIERNRVIDWAEGGPRGLRPRRLARFWR